MASIPEIKEIYSLINGHTLAKIIMKACELKIDELLHGQSLSMDELSKKLNFHEEAGKRFIRVLDAYEIVKIETDHQVTSGRLSPYLVHIRGPHLMNGYSIVHHLEHALQTNSECYSQHFGKTFSDHLLADANLQSDFNHWGRKTAEEWYIPIILKAYDFSMYASLCEMGQEGYLLTAILNQNGVKKAYLYTTMLTHHPLHPAITVCDGKNLPVCDLYIYFRKLLKLNDDELIKELKDGYTKMYSHAKILIIDFFIPDKNHVDYPLSTIADINVLSCTGGKIRNKAEWLALLQQTPFTFTQVSSSLENDVASSALPLIFIEGHVGPKNLLTTS